MHQLYDNNYNSFVLIQNKLNPLVETEIFGVHICSFHFGSSKNDIYKIMK